MRGFRNFRQGGGGPGQSDKKALTTFFFSPQLILQSQIINFKENYHFSRFLRESNIFQGGGGVQLFPGWGVPIAYSYRKYTTCDFPPPPPPLDPHLGLSMVLSIHAENAPNLTNRYLGMFLEGQADSQTDRRVHRRPTPKQYPSDFIGGKPVLSTGYLQHNAVLQVRLEPATHRYRVKHSTTTSLLS